MVSNPTQKPEWTDGGIEMFLLNYKTTEVTSIISIVEDSYGFVFLIAAVPGSDNMYVTQTN